MKKKLLILCCAISLFTESAKTVNPVFTGILNGLQSPVGRKAVLVGTASIIVRAAVKNLPLKTKNLKDPANAKFDTTEIAKSTQKAFEVMAIEELELQDAAKELARRNFLGYKASKKFNAAKKSIVNSRLGKFVASAAGALTSSVNTLTANSSNGSISEKGANIINSAWTNKLDTTKVVGATVVAGYVAYKLAQGTVKATQWLRTKNNQRILYNIKTIADVETAQVKSAVYALMDAGYSKDQITGFMRSSDQRESLSLNEVQHIVENRSESKQAIITLRSKVYNGLSSARSTFSNGLNSVRNLVYSKVRA